MILLSNLQLANKTYHIVVVQFSEKIDSQILLNIDGVQKIEEEKPFIYKLQTSDPENVKKQFLNLAWKII